MDSRMHLTSEMMPGSNTKHTIWRGHDPTTMLGSIFYYDRLKFSAKTLLFINGSHDRVCRWCKNRFVKEWGIHGLRWYCSKQCRIQARRVMVRASKAKIRIEAPSYRVTSSRTLALSPHPIILNRTLPF